MKKIIWVIIALALATLACSIKQVTPEPPTAVPPPTALPPTAVPPLPTATRPPNPTPLPPTAPPPVPTLPPAGNQDAIYYTSFDSNDADWDEFSSENSSVEIRDSQLIIALNTEQWEAWANPEGLTINQPVVMEASVQRLEGGLDTDYGFLCSYSDTSNYYMLTAHDDGTVMIHRRMDGESTLLAEADNIPVNRGGMNALRASCLEGFLSLEVNGVNAVEAYDSELPYGNVGLVAGVYDQSPARIAFDSITILNPEDAFAAIDAIMPGEVLYYTEFTSNDMNWHEGTNESGSVSFDGDRQLISVAKKNWVAWSIARNLAISQPVLIDVAAQHLAGPSDASYGVICGFQDGDNYFGVLTGDDNYAEVFQRANGNTETLDYVWTSPTQAGATNDLRVACMEDMIQLRVNNDLILEVPVEVTPGLVGLIAGNYETAGAEIAFDNFMVSEAMYSDGSADNADLIPLYFTNFETNDLAWEVGDWSDASIHLENNLYTIKIDNADWQVWGIPMDLTIGGPVVVDAEFKTDTTNIPGDYGIVCGFQDSANFYALTVSDSGEAEIFRWVNDEYETLASSTDAPTNLGDYNNLRASCLPDRLSLEVNGELVMEVEHHQVGIGQVALFARTFDLPGLQVSADYFGVYQSNDVPQ